MVALSSSKPTASTPAHTHTHARLVEYRRWPLPNPHLRGHATIDFNGWVVARIPVFEKADGTLSVGAPNTPEVDNNGRQRERDGKRVYTPLITFATNAARDRWQRMVLSALADGGVGVGGAP